MKKNLNRSKMKLEEANFPAIDIDSRNHNHSEQIELTPFSGNSTNAAQNPAHATLNSRGSFNTEFPSDDDLPRAISSIFDIANSIANPIASFMALVGTPASELASLTHQNPTVQITNNPISNEPVPDIPLSVPTVALLKELGVNAKSILIDHHIPAENSDKNANTSNHDALPTVRNEKSVSVSNSNSAIANSKDSELEFDPVTVISSDTNPVIHVNVGTTADELNQLISQAQPGTTFQLAEGIHTFNHGIVISRSDIMISGESEEGTILTFDFPAGEEAHAIQILGGKKDYITTLESSSFKGSNQIELFDTSNLSVGSKLYISQPNTQEYLLENGWDNVSWQAADERPFREVIAEVSAIDGNIVTLASDLAYDFAAINTKVFEIDLLSGIELSNFTVTHSIELQNNTYDFANVLPEFEKTASVMIKGTFEASLENISILDAPSNGFDIRASLNLSAENLHVDGAYNMGSGGNGYGIQLYETFGSTISDTEVFNVRHALLFSSWHAEADNSVELSSTNRDINFHGSPDSGNHVTVAHAIMDYDPSQNTGTTRGYWDIVGEGGSGHANTDFYHDNTVQFGHAEGSQGYETIYGWDDGAYLDGNGGWDTLFGGAGSDIIIGGTGKDKLYGGDGADIFAFRVGDSYDTIYDFSGASEGDSIAIVDAQNVQSFEDLNIWQDNLDTYIRYGGNSTIILSEFDSSSISSEDFVFDWTDDNWNVA